MLFPSSTGQSGSTYVYVVERFFIWLFPSSLESVDAEIKVDDDSVTNAIVILEAGESGVHI